VVECRFFAGMEETEIAAALGVSERTVRRDWVKARAWLYSRLYPEEAGETRP
jgi:DNA-directed RNA polymerase specialized sigma24 family protein